MDKAADFEIWRTIPPEEKLETMSRAHANGTFTALIGIIIASTLAVGLRQPWLLWTSIIVSPLLFQAAAGKAWRALRPRMMLEYLAARAAARRYAFAVNSNDMGVNLMLKAELQHIYENENLGLAINSMMQSIHETSVWVTLFNDALIILSEKRGGAHCEFAALTNDKLSVEAKNGNEESEYTNDKELILTVAPDKKYAGRKIKLTSRYPAALVVFEKKLLKAIDLSKAASELAKLAQEKEAEKDDFY